MWSFFLLLILYIGRLLERWVHPSRLYFRSSSSVFDFLKTRLPAPHWNLPHVPQGSLLSYDLPGMLFSLFPILLSIWVCWLLHPWNCFLVLLWNSALLSLLPLWYFPFLASFSLLKTVCIFQSSLLRPIFIICLFTFPVTSAVLSLLHK